MGGGGRRPDFVQSLERGLAVIRAFGPDNPQLTLSEVARITGLTRAAARRFLLTLVEIGYVHSDGRLFSLRPRVLELGYAYLSTLTLNEVAAVHMEEMVAELRESSSIAVLDGDDIAYVVRVPTRRIMTVAIAVGTRFPAYATSMGRALLANLPAHQLDAYLARVELQPLTRRTVTDREALRRVLADVEAQGYAVVDQELEDGLRSAAVPIHDRSGQVIAAINVSVHASRATLDQMRRSFLPRLMETASRIETDLRTFAVAGSTPQTRGSASATRALVTGPRT
ncbi:MAG: IclR family transcriptional regulator domain-containing protein [Acidimicrobiales bacterium]